MAKLFQQNLEFIGKKKLLYDEVLQKLRNNILEPNALNNSDEMSQYVNLRKDRYDEKCPGYQI